MKKLALLIFLLAAVMFMTACRGDEENGAGTNGQPVLPVVPHREGGELVYAMLSQPPHLDPIRQNDSATSDATHQMYEGLVRFEPYPSTEVVGLLATDWRQIDDITWEFDLRQGVYFHDGSYFNSDAMRISLLRLLDPREAAPGAFILETVVDVVSVDTYTLRIILEFPFAPIINHLTHQVGFAVSPAAMAQEVHYRIANGFGDAGEPLDTSVSESSWDFTSDEPFPGIMDWQQELLDYAADRGLTFPDPVMVTFNPNGTGPFRFDDQVSGDFTRFVRNEDYWGTRPILDSMRFVVIPDAVTRFLMLQTGEAHAIQASPIDVAQIEADPGLHLIRFDGVGMDYIGLTIREGSPLADVRVRRAVSMAINVEDIIAAAYEGIGVPATGPVGPNVAHSAAGELQRLTVDLDQARAYLEEAGFADGFTLNFWSNDGNAARATTGEIVQAQLAQIGITVNLELLEWSVYLERTGLGEADMFMLGWSTVTGDADYGIFPLFHTNNIGPAGNRSFFSNARVDALLEEGRVERDLARRDEIYREVTQILIDEAPWVFVRFPVNVWGINGLTGLGINFNNSPYFYRAALVE